jgi:hypothetical protein
VSTQDSRSAISRARFFLAQAKSMPPDHRNEFEAFLEAAVVFGRTAVHRFKTAYEKHPKWKSWWDPLEQDPTMLFFRRQRNLILKEGPPQIGQKVMMPSIGPGGQDIPAVTVNNASELYYFDDPETPATVAVEQHLEDLEQLLEGGAKFLT